MAEPNRDNEDWTELVSIIVLCFLCLAATILWRTEYFVLSPLDVITAFSQGLLIPWHGAFLVGHMFQGNAMTVFYAYMCFAIVICLTYYMYFVDSRPGHPLPALTTVMVTVGLIGFFLFAGAQQCERIAHYRSESSFIRDIPQEQRLDYLFGNKYSFVRAARREIRSSCPAHFLSYETTRDPNVPDTGAFLKYQLYPKLVSSFSAEQQAPCLVLFSDTDWAKIVPTGYRAVLTADRAKLIFATKQVRPQ